jgi:hypothetical protein
LREKYENTLPFNPPGHPWREVLCRRKNHGQTHQPPHTNQRDEAARLLAAMNEAGHQSAMNLSLAKIYLRHSDPLVASRTWQTVTDEIIRIKTGENQIRWQVMAKSKWFDPLRHHRLIETQAEHLLHVLQCGKVAINVYLRRMHNFAIDMNWLPASVLPKRQWPPVKFKDKRAITLEEHQKISHHDQLGNVAQQNLGDAESYFAEPVAE